MRHPPADRNEDMPRQPSLPTLTDERPDANTAHHIELDIGPNPARPDVGANGADPKAGTTNIA